MQSTEPLRPEDGDVIQLELTAIANGWAHQTFAQRDQYIREHLLGKWAKITDTIEDVWQDPPRVMFSVDADAPDMHELRKTHLNVSLTFRTAHSASIYLLSKGDTVTAIGRIERLTTNQFGVPKLELAHCDLVGK